MAEPYYTGPLVRIVAFHFEEDDEIGDVLIQASSTLYATISWTGELKKVFDFTGKPYANFRVLATSGKKAVLSNFTNYYVVDLDDESALGPVAGTTIDATQPAQYMAPNSDGIINAIGAHNLYAPQKVKRLDESLAVISTGSTVNMANTGNENWRHFNSAGDVGIFDLGDNTGFEFSPFFYKFNTQTGGPASLNPYESALDTATNNGGGTFAQPGIAVNTTRIFRPVVDGSGNPTVEIADLSGALIGSITVSGATSFIWIGLVCDEANLLCLINETGGYTAKHYTLPGLSETDVSAIFNDEAFSTSALANSRFSVLA